MFYTFNENETNDGKYITTKYKYANKFHAKLFSGKKSFTTNSLIPKT